MMAEEKKRKDWTKVDVKTIKKHLPKILLFFVLFLPLLYIMGLFLANMQNNAPNANSGITVENKTYYTNIPNITEAKDASEKVTIPTDLVKSMFICFPIFIGIFFILKLFMCSREYD